MIFLIINLLSVTGSMMGTKQFAESFVGVLNTTEINLRKGCLSMLFSGALQRPYLEYEI